VGVVIISDNFEHSKWCLRELNTFLLRRHQEPPAQFLLLPVYHKPKLHASNPLYDCVLGSLTSVIRKHEETTHDLPSIHEFLVTLVPRLLTAENIQHMSLVQNALRQIKDDPFLVKRLWNEYVHSLKEKILPEFHDPNPGRADLERIKSIHRTLTPTDIQAGLEVYQPLEYSLTPPAVGITTEVSRYSLEAVSLALLENKMVSYRHISDTFGVEDVTNLQKQHLVIILDGLDELGFKINLYKYCKLHRWTNTVFLITCRSEFLQESDIAQYMTPINPMDGESDHNRLGKLYILPFSDHQRSEYVEKFAKKYQSIFLWKTEDYLSSLKRVPELAAFLQEPLLLFMVLSVLPELDLGGGTLSRRTKEELSRFDPHYLDAAIVTKIKWLFPQIRRVELYALFLTSWIKREIGRLAVNTDHPPTDHRPKIHQVMSFCSNLAFQIGKNPRVRRNMYLYIIIPKFCPRVYCLK